MRIVASQWWRRYVFHPESVSLWITIVLAIALFAWLGGYLVPVFVSIALAYLLEGMVKWLDNCKIPHVLSVTIVCLFSIGVLLVLMFWLLPIIWVQLSSLISESPKMLKQGQALLMTLPKKYPDFISATQLNGMISAVQKSLTTAGQTILSYSVANISGFIEIIVYFILVPLLVFFFLKDDKKILEWCGTFVPRKNNRLLSKVWREINDQLSLYVRGKVFEILIVGAVTGVSFGLMGMNYAFLLGVFVGLSTIIPYIGAIVVTIPVVIIAYLQWGWSSHFLYLVLIYTIITAVDGNVLVPLIFSGTMKIHPVTVIVAILIFGGMFGFWGVFFAIPLATVVRAILNALRAYAPEHEAV